MSEPANGPVIADLKAHRNGRKGDRLQQLQHIAVRKLFWQQHGRRELSDAELQSWIPRQNFNADFDPYSILTAEEIATHDQYAREREAESGTD